jgi:hypothetical protein
VTRHATAIQAAGIKDDDLIQKFLEVDKEQLTLIISLIVNKSNFLKPSQYVYTY